MSYKENNSITLKFQTSSQLWKTYMMLYISKEHVKLVAMMSKFQPMSIQVINN
jgi:hypothetical protein